MVNWSRRRVGGGESYLAQLLPDVAEAGHAVALLVESDDPPDRDPIALPENAPWWSVAALGPVEALGKLRAWSPDVILSHGVLDNDLEASLLDVAPAVAFAHNYYGTCISGSKTWKTPPVRPCSRVLGIPCLLHYYPHSCGGKNPLTMIRSYRSQRRRLEMLERYGAIVTASEHMRREYLRHGFADKAVHAIPYPTPGLLTEGGSDASESMPHTAARSVPTESWNLVFMGRMERLKGADVLIDALPVAASALGVPVHADIIGDGPERGRWEAHARNVTAASSNVTIAFPGWQTGELLASHLRKAHLLVVPSLWPEPFGLVGPEAGLVGIPSVAFDVGGISQWLHEGVNGHLANGSTPSAPDLAAAIVRALSDPRHWHNLSVNAVQVARSFTRARHVTALLVVLAQVHARAVGTRVA